MCVCMSKLEREGGREGGRGGREGGREGEREREREGGGVQLTSLTEGNEPETQVDSQLHAV